MGKGDKERSNLYILLYLNSYVEKQQHLDIITINTQYHTHLWVVTMTTLNISLFGPWEFVKHYASDRTIFNLSMLLTLCNCKNTELVVN